MNADGPPRSSLFTPTRVVTLLALIVSVLCGAVFVWRLSGPTTVTLEVTEPAGKIIVFHLVVDGQPDSREGFAPVTYRFEAKELRYAVICLDATPPAEVTVIAHNPRGTGGSRTAGGVTGVFQSAWWGTMSQMSSMTPTHVANMRRSVIVEREGQAESDPR